MLRYVSGFTPIRSTSSERLKYRTVTSGTIRRKVAGRQLCVMGKRAACAFGLNAVSIARHIVRKQKPSCRPAPTVCAGKCCTARSCLALRSPTCSLQRTIRPRTQDHHRRLARSLTIGKRDRLLRGSATGVGCPDVDSPLRLRGSDHRLNNLGGPGRQAGAFWPSSQPRERNGHRGTAQAEA